MTTQAAPVVYKTYTRAQLDREYDNVRKVPNFDFSTYLAELNQANELARTQYKESFSADVPYGDGPDETMDLFLTNPGGPLHVFFHGGYWRMLHKNDFSYVANGIVAHGHNLAIINYSLIPTVNMGELVKQCVKSVEWLMAQGQAMHFDPARISVSGHSAGGHLAAMMATHSFQYELQSICAMSGIFDLSPIQLCFLNDVLALTDEEVATYSPVRRKPVFSGKLRLITGAQEGAEYERQAKELVSKWSALGLNSDLDFPEKHDHFTLRAALGNPDSDITKAVLFL
ncbi:alpha/beta hydrolase [Paenalcaligenes niemegkensis]|uniref:alpha/beta hydrolase n=1 Tax=Paenalcaligenes niemegkensis TaxID=2895469 RepID=UPI001EE828EA|nr:alpha/beta hydrolase [Paenalcaligenes niemegkensis]MCQ9617704.1 alpha/beta hydrolase [Paenalcaligenes niemegkensis]